MKTIVNFCGNCPFYVTHYDDFAVGKQTLELCNLAQFLNKKDYFLPEDEETPYWCPLKKDEYSYEFRNFSPKRLEEIEIIKSEIKKLEDYVDMVDDYENPEFIEKSNLLTIKYKKLSELHDNETETDWNNLGFDNDDFQDDINKQIGEIKEQLSALEEAGLQLQKTFNNLGNIGDEKNI